MRYCRFFLSGFFVLYPCHNLLCTTATIICRFFGPTRSSRDLLWKLKTFVLFFVFSAVSKTFTNARTRVSLIIGACYIIHSYTLSTTVVRHFFIIIISTRTRDRMIFADSNSDRRRRAFYRGLQDGVKHSWLRQQLFFNVPCFTRTFNDIILNARCSRELLPCTLFPCGFFLNRPCFHSTQMAESMHEGEVTRIFHT